MNFRSDDRENSEESLASLQKVTEKSPKEVTERNIQGIFKEITKETFKKLSNHLHKGMFKAVLKRIVEDIP